jgi:hypothetical protein
MKIIVLHEKIKTDSFYKNKKIWAKNYSTIPILTGFT